MNIYSNVDSRAEQCLAIIANMFGVTQDKTQRFYYKSTTGLEGSYWQLQYSIQKSLLSKVYKLKISYQFERTNPENFHLVWQHRKSCWIAKGEQGNFAPSLLNKNELLAKELNKVDYELVEVKKEGHLVTVTLIPIPGCFTWTLIPPMHYFVRIKPEEISSAKKVVGIIQTLLGVEREKKRYTRAGKGVAL